MKGQSDLASTEARVFRAYWQDGVLDLLAGASVVLIGLGWLAGFVLAGVVVAPAALALSASAALRLGRFAACAATFVASALAVAALDADPGWAIIAGGAVVAVGGAVLLRSFVRRFPCLPAEMDG